MSAAGWVVAGWVGGCFTTAATLFVWALIEEHCRKETLTEDQWSEDQPW